MESPVHVSSTLSVSVGNSEVGEVQRIIKSKDEVR